jgi:hypothetical protein
MLEFIVEVGTIFLKRVSVVVVFFFQDGEFFYFIF